MQIAFWHWTEDETQAKSALHFLKIFGSESKLQKCLPLGTREQGIGIWRTREKKMKEHSQKLHMAQHLMV